MEQAKLPAIGHRAFTREEKAYLQAAGFRLDMPTVASRRATVAGLAQYVRIGGPYGTWVTTVGNGMGLREWQSKDFDDPISAFVYAELNNWGQ